ncbi:MAG: 2-hydroxyacyl-CoA dehydratase family protein [Lachnospiraceae bacterium]
MTDLERIVDKLVSSTFNPIQVVQAEITRTKKAAVGCFLGFLPEELIYAAGLLPIGIWGGKTELVHVREYFPPFFCAPIQEMVEEAMSGTYTGILKIMVMPIYCDALRSASQNFKVAVSDIHMLPIVYPINRKSYSGMRFLASEYGELKEKLENFTGIIITNEKLEESIRIYNCYRKAMRDLVQAIKEHPGVISPYMRHAIIESSYYHDKKDFTEQILKLTNTIKKLPSLEWEGKKVILTGVLLDSQEILKEMEKQKITVITDYLIQESLQVQTDVPEIFDNRKDPLFRLTARLIELNYCSVVMDPKKGRIEEIIKEAKRENMGVIICIPSFCDPEEYDYPIMKKRLDEENIPNICLELHTEASIEQAKTKMQTFAEIW